MITTHFSNLGTIRLEIKCINNTTAKLITANVSTKVDAFSADDAGDRMLDFLNNMQIFKLLTIFSNTSLFASEIAVTVSDQIIESIYFPPLLHGCFYAAQFDINAMPFPPACQ